MRAAWTQAAWLRLALALLRHDRMRFAACVAGVCAALLLMLAQIVFRGALLDSSLELLRQIDADLIVLAAEKEPFLARVAMPRERLYQAQSVPGIAAAYPLWLDLVFWKNPVDGAERPIRVIGFAPPDPIFRNAAIAAHAPDLRRPWTGLIDARSRDSYGPLAAGAGQLARHPIEIVGTFPLGSDFEADGNLIVGEETAIALDPACAQQIEIAALRVAAGVDPETLLPALRAALPRDVEVYTHAALLARDLDYWKRGTPISIVLLFGVALAFAAGTVVCYQILYTDVLDHLREFATLVAMGYGRGFLSRVVMAQALALSLAGSLPAAALGFALQQGLGALTGLPVRFSPATPAGIALLSAAMCSAAGLLALRKLDQLDPAELF
jgi:putative ABC transport system permease protein